MSAAAARYRLARDRAFAMWANSQPQYVLDLYPEPGLSEPRRKTLGPEAAGEPAGLAEPRRYDGLAAETGAKASPKTAEPRSGGERVGGAFREGNERGTVSAASPSRLTPGAHGGLTAGAREPSSVDSRYRTPAASPCVLSEPAVVDRRSVRAPVRSDAAGSESTPVLTPGAEPHRMPGDVTAVASTVPPATPPSPSGGSAPSTPAEEAALSGAPTTERLEPHLSESSASAGLNRPGPR